MHKKKFLMATKTSITPIINWYVAQHKPNHHRIAQQNLEKQGFKTFLPLLEITKRKANEFISEKKPLFPGYIFVSFDRSFNRWIKINHTKGITRLISVNNTPQSISADFINSLRVRNVASKDKLSQGDKVEIVKGPFVNLIGVIEKASPQERVTLLFELMGQKIITSVSSKDVKVIH